MMIISHTYISAYSFYASPPNLSSLVHCHPTSLYPYDDIGAFYFRLLQALLRSPIGASFYVTCHQCCLKPPVVVLSPAHVVFSLSSNHPFLDFYSPQRY